MRALIAVFALAVTGCSLELSGIGTPMQTVRGSGLVIEDERPLRNVNGLILDAPGTVSVEMGDGESIRIEVEDNLLRYIGVSMDGGRLRIEVDSFVRIQPTVPIRYYVTVRELGRITASGDGRVEADGVRGDRLLVSSSGSGGVWLSDVRVNRLSMAVTGSGGVRATGRVPLVDASLNASGPLQARELDSDEATINVAGSGSATLRVRRRLDANVSGSGSVLYYGSPVVSGVASGSGEIRRLGS